MSKSESECAEIGTWRTGKQMWAQGQISRRSRLTLVLFHSSYTSCLRWVQSEDSTESLLDPWYRASSAISQSMAWPVPKAREMALSIWSGRALWILRASLLHEASHTQWQEWYSFQSESDPTFKVHCEDHWSRIQRYPESSVQSTVDRDPRSKFSTSNWWVVQSFLSASER